MIHIIGFNITWFGLVYWGNAFIPLAFVFLLLHFLFYYQNYNQLILIIVISSIGILTDSLLQYFDVFIFSGVSHIPFWLIMLWVCFSATLPHVLGLLGKSKLLSIILGLLAPFSYIAGYQLNAVGFGYSLLVVYCLLSIIWVLQFTLFLKLQTDFIAEGERDV